MLLFFLFDDDDDDTSLWMFGWMRTNFFSFFFVIYTFLLDYINLIVDLRGGVYMCVLMYGMYGMDGCMCFSDLMSFFSVTIYDHWLCVGLVMKCHSRSLVWEF